MDRLDCDRMYVAVYETGSFSAAARRLGVSSGQASKLVSKLESDLGVQFRSGIIGLALSAESGVAKSVAPVTTKRADTRNVLRINGPTDWIEEI